jgi:hypothetical protein
MQQSTLLLLWKHLPSRHQQQLAAEHPRLHTKLSRCSWETAAAKQKLQLLQLLLLLLLLLQMS